MPWADPHSNLTPPPSGPSAVPPAPRPRAGNRRILVVDDNLSIHGDFQKLLAAPAEHSGGSTAAELNDVEAELFGAAPAPAPAPAAGLGYELSFAPQGEEALRLAAAAAQARAPFALAFVDCRMPPGIDGIETIYRLWRIDPCVEVVICTAYADHSWAEIVGRLGETDQFLVLKKPFEAIEVRQLALALTRKWGLARDAAEPKPSFSPEARRPEAAPPASPEMPSKPPLHRPAPAPVAGAATQPIFAARAAVAMPGGAMRATPAPTRAPSYAAASVATVASAAPAAAHRSGPPLSPRS